MVTRWGGDEAEHGAGKKKRIIFLWLILIQGKNTNHHQSSNVWPPPMYTNKIYTSCGHLYRRTLTLAMLPPGSDWRVRRARSPPPLMCPTSFSCSSYVSQLSYQLTCSSYVSRTHIVSHQLLIRWALYRRLHTFGFLLKYNALQPLLLVPKILKIAVN